MPASRLSYTVKVATIAAGYYALAAGGKALLLTGPAGAFWPAVGFAIAVLYLGGLRWWPGVLLGDLGSLLADVLSLEVPPETALVQAAGDMAGVIVAVLILRRLAGPRAALDRVAHVGAVVIAVATGGAISAAVAMLAVRVGDLIAASDAIGFWRSWWLGDVAGGLVVLPAILAWARSPFEGWRRRPVWEGPLNIVSVVALSAAAFSADHPLTYMVFPAFIWAALRFRPQGATLAVAVAVVVAVWTTSNELGPFVEHSPSNSALNLQLFIAVAALTTLCLAAIVSERERAMLELAESRARSAAARAEERRRIEVELHDSAQNRLVGLQVRLALAEKRIRLTAPDVATALAGSIDEAVAVGDELRRIAQGVTPPRLAARGVADALRAECALSAMPVRIVADEIGRSAYATEITVYLCCLECVQNAAKHAGPDASVTVRLQREDDQLAFSVQDTGQGFNPHAIARGSGLAELHDRVNAVGGRVAIATAPGTGTTVTGVVPWPARTG